MTSFLKPRSGLAETDPSRPLNSTRRLTLQGGIESSVQFYLDPLNFCIEYESSVAWQHPRQGYWSEWNIATQRLEWVHRSLLRATKGMEVDHLCHNGACIRIDHLRLVTPLENRRNQWRNPTCKVCGGRDWGLNATALGFPSRRCKDCAKQRLKKLVLWFLTNFVSICCRMNLDAA